MEREGCSVLVQKYGNIKLGQHLSLIKRVTIHYWQCNLKGYESARLGFLSHSMESTTASSKHEVLLPNDWQDFHSEKRKFETFSKQCHDVISNDHDARKMYILEVSFNAESFLWICGAPFQSVFGATKITPATPNQIPFLTCKVPIFYRDHLNIGL